MNRRAFLRAAVLVPLTAPLLGAPEPPPHLLRMVWIDRDGVQQRYEFDYRDPAVRARVHELLASEDVRAYRARMLGVPRG